MLLFILALYAVTLNMILVEYYYFSNPDSGLRLAMTPNSTKQGPRGTPSPTRMRSALSLVARTSEQESALNMTMNVSRCAVALVVHGRDITGDNVLQWPAVLVMGRLARTQWPDARQLSVTLVLQSDTDHTIPDVYQSVCDRVVPRIRCRVVALHSLSSPAVARYMQTHAPDSDVLILQHTARLDHHLLNHLQYMDKNEATCLSPEKQGKYQCSEGSMFLPVALMRQESNIDLYIYNRYISEFI